MIDVTSKSFRKEVMEAEEPVLLDFWAPWYPPCRGYSSIVARAAGKMKLCRVNVDDEPELAAAFHISTVPTVTLMRDGMVIDERAGICSEEELKKLVVR